MNFNLWKASFYIAPVSSFDEIRVPSAPLFLTLAQNFFNSLVVPLWTSTVCLGSFSNK